MISLIAGVEVLPFQLLVQISYLNQVQTLLFVVRAAAICSRTFSFLRIVVLVLLKGLLFVLF